MPDLDSGANAFFKEDHRACDDAWGAFEAALSAGDREGARKHWEKFHGMMERHFRMEEEVLFPAIEDATGMRGMGPVAVMRHEHAQMRALLAQMVERARAGELDALLDDGDTLLMVIQQHNAKEEGILYPLADRVLAGDWPTLAGRLRGYLG
jgi:iron-sulfur cluster repair protein YtfE (RIC family)